MPHFSSVTPTVLLREMLDAAIAAAQAAQQLAKHLPPRPKGRTIVVGAGKASAAMAQALEAAWQGPLEGLVVTRYGHAVPCAQIEIVEAAHPVPDHAGELAAQRMLKLVHGLTADDLVICLISGGGSALLPLALPGITLQDKQHLSKQLLRSGASIQEMNCVRRHLSAIKGGRLALACAPASVWNLIISDVPGDSPCDIASGPSVVDATTCVDALAVLKRYHIDIPPHIHELLSSGQGETPKFDQPGLPSITTTLIATPQMALEAAAQVAALADIPAHILSDAMEGESRDVGKTLASIALQVKHHSQPFTRPCVLLSGGETTVTLKGQGRGGRNVECALALAIALRGQEGIYALMADTDGIDGLEEKAGALVAPDSLARADVAGLRSTEILDDNHAHYFFETLGDSVITGPTLTNVNDFRAILIL